MPLRLMGHDGCGPAVRRQLLILTVVGAKFSLRDDDASIVVRSGRCGRDGLSPRDTLMAGLNPRAEAVSQWTVGWTPSTV
jgi:hypothetical protein